MELKKYNYLNNDAITIRKTVFVDEQKFSDEFDDIDKIATHFVMYDNDEYVATCRVFKSDESKIYILGRLAVIKKYRGQNIGKVMLKEAEKYVKEMGGEYIKLHAQCRAIGFYNACGYTKYGEIEDDQGCPHIWMKKKI